MVGINITVIKLSIVVIKMNVYQNHNKQYNCTLCVAIQLEINYTPFDT